MPVHARMNAGTGAEIVSTRQRLAAYFVDRPSDLVGSIAKSQNGKRVVVVGQL